MTGQYEVRSWSFAQLGAPGEGPSAGEMGEAWSANVPVSIGAFRHRLELERVHVFRHWPRIQVIEDNDSRLAYRFVTENGTSSLPILEAMSTEKGCTVFVATAPGLYWVQHCADWLQARWGVEIMSPDGALVVAPAAIRTPAPIQLTLAFGPPEMQGLIERATKASRDIGEVTSVMLSAGLAMGKEPTRAIAEAASQGVMAWLTLGEYQELAKAAEERGLSMEEHASGIVRAQMGMGESCE